MNLDEILAMSAGLMSVGIYSINVNFPKMRGIQYVLLAASNRRPSTPKEKRSFAYSASRWRTGSVSVARLPYNNRQHIRIDLESRCVLCKAVELAGPYFDFVVPVSNVVVGLKAAVMEIVRLVDRIAVVREG